MPCARYHASANINTKLDNNAMQDFCSFSLKAPLLKSVLWQYLTCHAFVIPLIFCLQQMMAQNGQCAGKEKKEKKKKS